MGAFFVLCPPSRAARETCGHTHTHSNFPDQLLWVFPPSLKHCIPKHTRETCSLWAQQPAHTHWKISTQTNTFPTKHTHTEPHVPFFLESQTHRMVWVARDLEGHLVPIPLPLAGTPSTMPHPVWLWKSPGMWKWSHCIHHFSWVLVILLLTRKSEWTCEGQKTSLSKMLITQASLWSRINGKVNQR